MAKPSGYVCNQPPRSTQPGHSSVGRRNVYQLKLDAARSTSPVSAVLQCKLVSGRGLRKLRSTVPYGLYGLGGLYLHFDVIFICIK